MSESKEAAPNGTESALGQNGEALSSNKRRQLRKKQLKILQRKKRKDRRKKRKQEFAKLRNESKDQPPIDDLDDEIDYVSHVYKDDDDLAHAFHDVFKKFTAVETLVGGEVKEEEKEEEKQEEFAELLPKPKEKKKKKPAAHGDEDTVLSNKKRKLLKRIKIADLKASVNRPDLVQEHDCNSSDPRLLLFLKSTRNTVPVPPHWSQKRKYLQGKRGFLKPPFRLPEYIASTGITQMRDAQLDSMGEKSMKQKQRDRMRPKRGKISIDYQVLHDAFFKHQRNCKPEYTSFGDMYYEGKEFEVRYRKCKPGYISDKLKKALGMQPRYKVICPNGVVVQSKQVNEMTGDVDWLDGQKLPFGTLVTWSSQAGNRIEIAQPKGWVWLKAKDQTENLKRIDIEDPPPWLINMQRFGPPPSYPDLKIPGLNAPIPPAKMYGFHEGQWGKPPVDENGQPLYGNPFDVWVEPVTSRYSSQRRWGEVGEASSSEEESSDEDEDEEMIDQVADIGEPGIQSNTSGITSVTSGIVTPSDLSLRKAGSETPSSMGTGAVSGLSTPKPGETGPALYHILEPKETEITGRFGTQAVYNIPETGLGRLRGSTQGVRAVSGSVGDSTSAMTSGSRLGARGQVNVAIDPDEIAKLNAQGIKRTYEAIEDQASKEDEPTKKKRRTRFGGANDE